MIYIQVWKIQNWIHSVIQQDTRQHEASPVNNKASLVTQQEAYKSEKYKTEKYRTENTWGFTREHFVTQQDTRLHEASVFHSSEEHTCGFAREWDLKQTTRTSAYLLNIKQDKKLQELLDILKRNQELHNTNENKQQATT